MQTAKPEEPISSPCAVCALEDRIVSRRDKTNQVPRGSITSVFTSTMPSLNFWCHLRMQFAGGLLHSKRWRQNECTFKRNER